MATDDQPPARGPRCPICNKPAEQAFRPFCSKRCADVDLGRWLRGTYAVAGHKDAEEDGNESRPNGKGEE